MFLLFSCSNDNKSIKEVLNNVSGGNTTISNTAGVKVYNFTASIAYGSVKDINMSLIFLKGDRRVIWTGETRLGYIAPLGIGTFNKTTGEIVFDYSEPINDIRSLRGSPIMKISEENNVATLEIVEPGGNLNELFNGNTEFKLNRAVNIDNSENSLEGTKWKSDDNGMVFYFISDYAAKCGYRLSLYTFNKGKIAIIPYADNPIDDDVYVGHIHDNTMYLQRDGLMGDSRYKMTLRKF